MQPAEEDGLIDDLKPITVENRTRQVTAEDKKSWEKLTRERVTPWPDEARVEEVTDQEFEWNEYITEAI
jgi:hypothetical protein